jgi:8-oxo-dGTP pyrophosphatase MutT (NUDIX family)
MKYGREISAGGVLYRPAGKSYEVALIRPKGKNVEALPKGLIDEAEKAEATALREVREETGMLGELEAPLGSIDYYYYSKERDTRFFKLVYFFLLRYAGGSERDHDWEVEEVGWVPIEEAVRSLSYNGEREVMQRALDTLKERESQEHGAGEGGAESM